MDPEELGSIRTLVNEATQAVTLENQNTDIATAIALAVTISPVQDTIDSENVRNVFVVNLAAANTLSVIIRNTTDSPPPLTTLVVFILTPGQVFPNQIFDYITKNRISIYERLIIPF